MAESKQHRTAVLKLIHDEREAAPFLFGYLLTDIPDATLCAALAAWRRHASELEAVMAAQAAGEVEAWESINL